MTSLLLLLGVVTTPTPKESASAALKELHGEWRAISVEEKGRAWDSKEEIAEVVIEITGDTLIYRRNKPVEKFRITLNLDKKPAQIDLRLIQERAKPDRVCHAIYAIEGGKLKLCLPSEFAASEPEARPSEFRTGGKRPPQGRLLFVMERMGK